MPGELLDRGHSVLIFTKQCVAWPLNSSPGSGQDRESISNVQIHTERSLKPLGRFLKKSFKNKIVLPCRRGLASACCKATQSLCFFSSGQSASNALLLQDKLIAHGTRATGLLRRCTLPWCSAGTFACFSLSQPRRGDLGRFCAIDVRETCVKILLYFNILNKTIRCFKKNARVVKIRAILGVVASSLLLWNNISG